MAEPEKTVNPDRRAESLTNYVDGNPLDVSLNDDTIWKDDLDPLKANQLVNSPSTLNDHPKKRSAFQITSVKPASQNENDGDSMDDLDESHTEEVSSLDWSKTDVDQDPSSEDTVSNVNIDEINNSNSNTNRPAEDVNQNEEKATTRFRVVKIESQKPFIRGRWKCFDFLDPPIEHQKTEHEKETGSGNSSAASSIHYVHGEDDPSKNPLGGTVFIQGDNQQMIVASPTRSMISMPGIQDPGKPQQPTQQHQQTYPAQNGSVPHASSVPQDYKPNQTVVTNVTNQSVTGQSVDFHHQQVQQPPATTASQNQFQASTGTGSPSSQHVVQSDGHSAQSVPQNVNHLQMGSSTSVSSGVRQVPGQQQHTIPTQPSSTPQQPLPVTTQAQSGQSSTEFRPTTPSDYAPGISASASQPAVLSQPTNPPTVNQPVQSAQMSHSSGATTQPAQVNPLQPHSVTRDSTPAPAGAAPSQTSDYSNIPVPDSNSISQPANSSVSTTSKLYEHEPKPSKPAAPAEPESALSVNTNAHVGTPSSRDSSDMSSVASVLMETLHGTMTIANISPQPGSPTGRVDATEGAEGTGSSTVAIDNKIEAAMDLVKSHLMFAVREEVEVLKEQIKGLIETNKQLQIENQALRQSSAPETVAAIPQTSPEEPPTSSS